MAHHRTTREAEIMAMVFAKLLRLTARQKRELLDQYGAPNKRTWTATEKADVLAQMARVDDSKPDIQQTIAKMIVTPQECYTALDILREPVQVVTLANLAEGLGCDPGTTRALYRGTGARYLAITSSERARRRVDTILAEVRLNIIRLTGGEALAEGWRANILQSKGNK